MCPASKHGEVSMEEEEKIMKRYEKGLSKAALRFLEEEETLTKEFTESGRGSGGRGERERRCHRTESWKEEKDDDAIVVFGG